MNYPRITSAMINAKGFDGQNPFIPDALQAVKNLQEILNGLRGNMFYVDPLIGVDASGDADPSHPFKGIDAAYDACVSGAGDGITVLSAGITAAETTSYLAKPIDWSKHGISVFGIAAPVNMFGRARIANVEKTTGALTTLSFLATGSVYQILDSANGFVTAGFAVGQTITVDSTSNTNDGNYTISAVAADGSSITVTTSVSTEAAVTAGSTTIKTYNAHNILLSGNNNLFYNIDIWNGGSLPSALGGVNITGARNYFANSHIVGGAGCTASANERSLELGAGAQENNFVGCVIGTDTVDRGNNANCELYLNGDTNTARNEFIGCKFIAQAEGGTAHGAIKSAAATALGRHMIFRDCDFMAYKSNLGSDQASVFIGTGLNTAKLFIIGNSYPLGYAAWDANAANNCVFVTNPAVVASAGGGVPTTN